MYFAWMQFVTSVVYSLPLSLAVFLQENERRHFVDRNHVRF